MYKKINIFLIGCFSLLTIYTNIGFMLYIPLLFYYLIKNIKNLYLFTISGVISLLLSFFYFRQNYYKMLVSHLVPFLLLILVCTFKFSVFCCDELLHKGQDVPHALGVEVADVGGLDAVLGSEALVVHINADGVRICGVEADDPLVVAVFREVAHSVGVINVGESRRGNLTGVIPRSYKNDKRVRIGLEHSVKHNIDASHKGL